MSPLVPITMYGWLLVQLLLFSFLPPRRAVVVGMLGAWLFLPMAGYSFSGFPDITKMSIACVGVVLGAVIFDPTRFLRLRWSGADLAMFVWVIVPLPSAVTSGYGAYEGYSGVLNQIVSWGMPYLIGRLYFDDAEGLRELAVGIFVGGLVYVPLVLYEARMSPQLHTMLYGFHQHEFAQSKRYGGWRPTVFMQHGLAVAMFMGTAAVCGMWLWTAGKLRALKTVPVWALACGLFAVAATCRSMYALILMLAGTAVLFASRLLGTRVIICVMLALAPLYIFARTLGGWDAQELRDVAALMGEERGGSLGVRLDSEDALWSWVKGDVLLGKGRLTLMNLSRSEYGRFIPDGLWLIALGKFGMVGLVSMLGVLLWPPALYLWRHRARALMSVEMAGATVLMMVLVLYTMDNLMNAMVNPIYLVAAGGLAVCRMGGAAEKRAQGAPMRRDAWALRAK